MPPATIVLDNTVAEFRRSPAAVVHQDCHHAVVLTELFPDTLLDRSPGIVIELNVCSNSEVSSFWCLIGWIVKTYDYFLYVASTLPQSVCVGT